MFISSRVTKRNAVYSPESIDVNRLKSSADAFKMSGDGVFHTIQGEGPRLGYPITFIRLHYCNLSCVWCDTSYTWDKTSREYWREPWDLPITGLNREIQEAQKRFGILQKNIIRRICFTGGEPLLQQDKIVKFLRQNPDYYTEIETNCTIMPDKYLLERNKKGLLFFNCSPKLSNSLNHYRLRFNPDVVKAISKKNNPVFKFVCKSSEDIKEALTVYGQIIPHNLISIMPEGVTVQENMKVYKKIIRTVVQYGLATHPRLQNIAFGGAKRGV